MKSLRELAALLSNAQITGELDVHINNIVHDSRKVAPGGLFVCLQGATVDGHNYIEQAIKSGAAALLVEKEVPYKGVPIIKVGDTRQAMQVIVPYFFDFPGKKLRMIGVTGTNGKTTTTHIIRKILMHAGYKVGLIGTIHSLIGEEVLPAKNTTPDVVDLQAVLAQMVDRGMEYVVMEVSSHALELNRIVGCEFDVGVYSNITRDHLDFHKTFENYIKAKAKLFQNLSDGDNQKTHKSAVINVDDEAAKAMIAAANCPVITYAVKDSAQLEAKNIDIKAKGMSFVIQSPQGELSLDLKVTGIFNVYNILAAVGAAIAEKVPLQVIKEALEDFKCVPGRFELVEEGQSFSVIVDYAHTPDGLENILKTAQEFAKGKIIVVFGCGGDRDRTKRPIMGRIAAQYADVVIATSDNPRSEDPEAILTEIEVGIKEALQSQQQYAKISDRKEAIHYALKTAQDDDIILIAGKGHETYQILKNKTIDFDDRAVVRELIREMR